jgi:DNA-binding beta-propeller fold protein YncE
MGVEGGSVVVIDMTTGEPKKMFQFIGGGGQMVMSKKYGKVFTDSSQPGTSVAAFDLATHELLKRIGFQGANAPGSGLAIDEEAGLLFVAIQDHNAVGVASIETLEPLAFFKVGGCPYGVELDVTRGRGFVTNTGDGSVSMFDLEKVRETLSK